MVNGIVDWVFDGASWQQTGSDNEQSFAQDIKCRIIPHVNSRPAQQLPVQKKLKNGCL
ncbi:MAG: hypothetical protein J5I98_28605 [Phaeodactylibacter sp.]|nr:hypothetical protein [Phaeodactylibacter sp.]